MQSNYYLKEKEVDVARVSIVTGTEIRDHLLSLETGKSLFL